MLHPAAAWNIKDTIALTFVTAVAAAVRGIRLGEPDTLVFDEAFYAGDACLYAGLHPDECNVDPLGEVHPPFGKLILALGIRLLGFNPAGWRIAAVVAGTLTVAVLFVTARRLFGKTHLAALAAGLLGLDVLHVVQSRIAMLDIFVALFTLTAMYFVLVERDRTLGTEGSRRLTWNRVCIGIAGGLALSTKWSGALVVVAAAWLLLAWSARTRPETSTFRRFLATLPSQAPSLGGALVVVPLLVYGLTFAGGVRAPLEGTAHVETVADGFRYNLSMLEWHSHFVEVNPAQSPPWSWPLIKRPVPFYASREPDVRMVWFGGNPLVWWPALLALAFVVVRWWRAQDPKAPEGFIASGFLLLHLPWILLTLPLLTWGRAMVFIFYLLPAIPFMYLAVASAVSALAKKRLRVGAAAVVAGVSFASFAFFYPILTAVPLTRNEWRARIWFEDCAGPPPQVLQLPATTGSGRGRTSDRSSITLPSGNPPYGWCWR